MPLLLPVAQLLDRLAAKLERHGISSPRLDSLLIIERATSRDRAWLLAHPEYLAGWTAQYKIQRLAARRARRIPLAYLLGKTEFYGLDFFVNRHVLIPRPETEALVAYAIKAAPPGGRLLDVGTGCGVIAVSTAKHRPDLRITASDISEQALKIAAANAVKNSVRDIDFRQSDIMDDISGPFDLIAANLPYLPSGRPLQPELYHEPTGALLSGADGLGHYRRLLRAAGDHLATKGQLVIEAAPQQAGGLKDLARSNGWKLKLQAHYLYVFEKVA